MKGKVIILFLMLFLLTGCDAVYRLEYVGGMFNESLTINNLSGYENEVNSVYSFDLSTNYDDVSDYTKEEGLERGYTYYDKKLVDNNGLTLSYNYTFSKEDYSNSYIAKTVYPKLNFQNEQMYSGYISDIYVRYPALNNIVIEFTTDKYVGYNNADKVLDNTYYWYLDKENYESKKIEMHLSNVDNRDVIEKLQDQVSEIEIDSEKSYLKEVLIGLGIILLGVGIFIFIKFINSNKK